MTLHDPAKGPLLTQEVKPNLKTLGPKFGPRLKEVQAAIAAADRGDAGGEGAGAASRSSCAAPAAR